MGMALTGSPGQEALARRNQVPSRALRARLRNLQLGCVPHTRGSLSKRADRWDQLGPDKQRRMLKCPCRDPAGDRSNKPQDAMHMLLECNETGQVRRRVREVMDEVVGREGTQEDKDKWARMGG